MTRIKTNTLFENTQELELPDFKDQDILKDENIQLNGKKAVETGMDKQQLRLVHVYKEDENKVIEIVTNNLDWTARTIADLYKKRWDIELFFYVKLIFMQSGIRSLQRIQWFQAFTLQYHFA